MAKRGLCLLLALAAVFSLWAPAYAAGEVPGATETPAVTEAPDATETPVVTEEPAVIEAPVETEGAAVTEAPAAPAEPEGEPEPIAEGEVPAAETDAPASEETPAPETETPAPGTETPAPETETPEPETETPEPEATDPAPAPDTSGTIGELTWSYANGVFTIGGKGQMPDFDDEAESGKTPWLAWKDMITKLVIGDEVTGIGVQAFAKCAALTEVTLPASVAAVGKRAFDGSGLVKITVQNGDCVIFDEANTMGTPGTTTICALADSAVQGYAGKYGYTFAPLDQETEPTATPEPTTEPTVEPTATPEPMPLSAPKLKSAAWSGNKITVQWKAVKGAARYQVYYKVGDGEWQKAGKTTGNSYTWGKGKAGTIYTFTVCCVDSTGEVRTSGFDPAGVTPENAAAPKVSSVANKAAGLTIKWKAVEGAAQYRVFYKPNGTGKWKKLTVTEGTSYTWEKAKSGVKYAFTVRCLSADGEQYTSQYDQTGKSIIYVAAPKITKVTATRDGVKVKWGKVAGAGAYRILYKAEGSGKWKRLTVTGGTSYTWPEAKSGVRYSFTVRCLGADRKTNVSGYDGTGQSILYIAAPKVKKVANTAEGIQVTWKAVEGASGYRVSYKTAGTGWVVAEETTQTSTVLTAAESGKTYTIRVRAIDSEGVLGPYEKTAKSATRLTAPVLTEVSSTVDGVKITWEKMEGVAKYQVLYKTTGGWKKAGETKKASYTWEEAKSGTVYAFTVQAFDNNGAASAYDTTGLSLHYLAAPAFKKTATQSTSSIKVTWKKVDGAVLYELYFKNGEEDWVELAAADKTSYTLDGLTTGVGYIFKLRAVAADETMSSFTDDRKTMVFTNSPLATYTNISPNKNEDRDNFIDTITIHCTAGQGSVETFGSMFAKPSKKASSNYGIGKDGRIGLFVEEKSCSWCSSNRPNDNRAITIEVSSDSYEPYWVTAAAYNSLLDLVTDVCARNGIKKLVWSYDANVRINHLDGCNMTCHRDFYPKSCPGTYLYTHEEAIAAEVNSRLAAMGIG